MITLQAWNLGVLGSCFCFTPVRRFEGLHTKLFSTTACDLADECERQCKEFQWGHSRAEHIGNVENHGSQADQSSRDVDELQGLADPQNVSPARQQP